MINLIVKPVAYLKIKLSDDSKQKYDLDIKYPFLIAIVMSLIFVSLYVTNNSISIFSTDVKFLSSFISFYQAMPGFYIAALAAIATFPSNSMNLRMPEPTPYGLIDPDLPNINQNRDYLSRRRFLCYMFSYLAFISIAFFFIATFLDFAYSFSLFKIPNLLLYIGYFLSCCIIFFTILQSIFITFLGLWYLGHRIHLNDNQEDEEQ